MSAFSDLLLDYSFSDESYPSPEQQLIWRIEDLKHIDLKSSTDSCKLSNMDLLYALPECFGNCYDIEKAIEMAVAMLRDKYGIVTDHTENIPLKLGSGPALQGPLH